MSKPKSNIHDGYVTQDDLVKVKDAIARDDLNRLVCELIIREPHLGAGVSDQFAHMVALLEGVPMSIEQQVVIRKHLIQLVWSPLIALAAAHRRAWEDFLPLTRDGGNIDIFEN